MTFETATARLGAIGAAASAVVLAFSGISSVHAGQKIEGPNGSSLTIGGGLRATFRATEGTSTRDGSNDFDVESARIYLNGQVNKMIGATFNTEIDTANDELRMLDAIVRFEINDYLNIWAGRLLPPSDRANLDGPYYLGTWDYPGVVSGYPAIFAGRDNGVSLFGQVGGGKFKYAFGAFEGCSNSENACSAPSTGPNTAANRPNKDDNLIYSGKLTYNFWDAEPGYYTSSDYYGSKEILAISITGMHQSDATGTRANPNDYNAWNIDALMQKKLPGGGVLSLEGAYYNYDVGLSTGTHPGLIGGQAYLAQASYLIPYQVGIGKFQPVVRYQDFKGDAGYLDTERWDGGVNYIIKDHDARVSAQYSDTKTQGASSVEQFVLGVQLQY